MKILACRKCGNLIILTTDRQCCPCGLSGGRYVNNLVVVVFGPAIVVAMSNSDIADAMGAKPNEHRAIRAWKMGRRGDSVRWVRNSSMSIDDDYLKQMKMEMKRD